MSLRKGLKALTVAYQVNKVILLLFKANPLHYYVLRVPRYADRERLYGLFLIHTPLGQTKLLGRMCVSFYVLKEVRLGWLHVYLFCSVSGMMKAKKKMKPGAET